MVESDDGKGDEAGRDSDDGGRGLYTEVFVVLDVLPLQTHIITASLQDLPPAVDPPLSLPQSRS
jgi:hypothetical protein